MAKAELGVILQDLRGKAGNAVFSKSRDGIVLKPKVNGRNPNTPAQQAVRENLRDAAAAFRNLNATQAKAWQNYANSVKKDNAISGKDYNPTAINAFTALASKFLAVNPNGTIPVTPPTSSFIGDRIGMSVTAGTGKLTFTASAPNSANVTTEFLLQPLASPNRKPQPKAYRSYGFFQFETGSLSHEIEVPPGYFAAAYRFVNKLTGQQTNFKTLSIQQVSFAIASSDKSEKTRKAA
jgi:hypothetical protein